MTHEAQGRVFMAQSKLLGDKASARWALPAELSGAGGEIGVVAIFLMVNDPVLSWLVGGFKHNYGTSPFLMGKLTINGDFP